MWRRALDAAAAWRRRLRDPALETWIRSRRRLQDAPYPLELYAQHVRRLATHPGLRLAAFTEVAAASSEAQLLVRHDVDMSECLTTLAAVLAVDSSLGVRAGVYLRADGEAYALPEARPVALQAVEAGFEVGLHTSAYARDDVLGAFARERADFESALGFPARSVTVHGLGTFRLEHRRRFVRELARRADTLGLDLARRYHYVMEDCHLDPVTGRRFVYDDFARLPDFLRPGRDYLVLTHPGYWTADK